MLFAVQFVLVAMFCVTITSAALLALAKARKAAVISKNVAFMRLMV